MTDEPAIRRTAVPIAVLALLALLGALLVTGTGHHHAAAAEGPGHDNANSTAMTAHSASYASERPAMDRHASFAVTRKQAKLHDAMRVLWEQHAAWTRFAIITFAAGSPGFDANAARLLQNQDDIGDAIKPYYGKAAGNRLATLLREHITTAVEVLQAAKAGDTAAFDEANARWYANGRQIADFLHSANPRSWGRKMMRSDMRTHLDQTLKEAAAELGGEYAASARAYDRVEKHLLRMADMLSDGIIAQFPGRFR